MYIISSPYTLGKNLYISYKICKVFTDWKNYVTKYDENVYYVDFKAISKGVQWIRLDLSVTEGSYILLIANYIYNNQS